MRFEYMATSSSFGSDANASAKARAPRGAYVVVLQTDGAVPVRVPSLLR